MQRDVLKRSVALWVNEAMGPVNVAACNCSQRAEHDTPHATSCRALGVSTSWFYKWTDHPRRQQRRDELDAAVKAACEDSAGTYG